MTDVRTSPGAVDSGYYEIVTPGSLAERLAIFARDRIYDDFIRLCRPRPEDTILDVGVSDVIGEAANMMERRYPYPQRLTAVELGTAEEFRTTFPDVTYRQIKANEPLPFPNGAFDIAASNAVLEHVGSVENQLRFVSELMRVGRRVFITVPNRFFPVEPHTGIPVLHWTDSGFALTCRLLGKKAWTEKESLILMSLRKLRALCPPGAQVEVGRTGIPLGPCSANLYLFSDERTTA